MYIIIIIIIIIINANTPAQEVGLQEVKIAVFVKSLGHDSKYLDYGMGPFAKVQLFRAWNRLLMKLSSSYLREIDFQAIQRKKESSNSALWVNKGEIYLVLDFVVWFSQCSF